MTNIGIKLKIYPNKKQTAYFEKSFAASRYIWNNLLDELHKNYKLYLKSNKKDNKYAFPSKFKLNNMEAQLKKKAKKLGNDWLYDVDSTSLQLCAENLHQSYVDFFNHKQKSTGKPKFKSYRYYIQSFSGKQIDRAIRIAGKYYIRLPKINYVKTSRTDFISPNAKIKRYTVTRTSERKYILSLILEIVDKNKLPKTHKAIGIDAGLKDLGILSNGEKIPAFGGENNRDNSKKWQSKYSRRYSLAKRLIAQDKDKKVLNPRDFESFHDMNHARIKKAHYQIKLASERKYYLDWVSTTLVKKYDVIAIEDLTVLNMLKNHKLAHNIANQGWHTFRSMLQYKCDWYGKKLIVVDPKNTSRICWKCHKKNEQFDNLPMNKWLAVRQWTCPYCGAKHDRDVNAAKNILARAIKKY